MRILIDGSGASLGGGGIARHIEGLVSGLLAKERDFEIDILRAPNTILVPTPVPGVTWRSTRIWNRPAAEQFGTWWCSWRSRPAIVHNPGFPGPIVPHPGRLILTVHDLSFDRPDRWFPMRWKLYWRWAYALSRRRAAMILTVTEVIRQEIIERWKLPSSMVRVVGNAVTHDLLRAPDMKVLSVRGLAPRAYFLAVGLRDPRKGRAELVQACNRYASMGGRLPIVTVGQAGWGPELSVKLSHQVDHREFGFVDDNTLFALMGGATALIYLSTYEGFGLPVLEGLAAGTQVIASDIPAVREAGGPWPTYVVMDPEAIAEAMVRVANCGLPPAARQWALSHTWDKVADRVVAAYRDVTR